MNKKYIKNRSFLSIGTFLFFILLVFSGIGLHYLDYLSPSFLLIYFKTLHTISALGFLIFSIGHIWKNWKVIKSYMNGTAKKTMSKEMFIGVIMIIIILIISWFKAVTTANEYGI